MADVPESFDVHVQRALDVVKEDRVIAWGRDEHDSCEAGTPGCSINHGADRGPCEGW